MRYAGFWPRLGAILVDTVVIVPIIALAFWGMANSQTTALVTQVITAAVAAIYPIYFIGRWGQTLGKMAVGIEVLALDGAVAGFRRALYRSSVDLGFSAVSTLITVFALLSIDGNAYRSLGLDEKMEALGNYAPTLESIVSTLTYLWVISELIVLLFNEKRRALHDFIAGTVVVHTKGKIVDA
jgi:uncharacterized RDD family membrane protein YckC